MSGRKLRLAVMVVVSSAFLLAWVFPIVWSAFFGRSERFARYDEAGAALVVPPVLTAAASIALGLAPALGPDFWGLAQRVATAVLGGGS